MKKFIVGTITEKLNKENKIIYFCSFFNDAITLETANKNEMLDFLADHAQGIINTGETEAVDIEYINKDKYKHYLLIRKNANEKLIIHEETPYEYHKTYRYFFKSDINRRVINERSYNFSEIVRISSNFGRKIEITRFIVIALLITISILSLVFAFNFYDSESLGFGIYLELLFTNFVSVTGFFSLSAWYFYHNGIKQYRKISNASVLYDWRQALKKRTLIRVLILTVLFINVVLISIYIWNLYHDNAHVIWQSTAIVIANLVILYGSFFYQIGLYLLVIISMRRNFKKYFPKLKWAYFSKWYHKESVPEKSGMIQDMFLFALPKANYLSTTEMQFAKRFAQEASRHEQKEYINKRLNNLTRARNIYLKSFHK